MIIPLDKNVKGLSLKFKKEFKHLGFRLTRISPKEEYYNLSYEGATLVWQAEKLKGDDFVIVERSYPYPDEGFDDAARQCVVEKVNSINDKVIASDDLFSVHLSFTKHVTGTVSRKDIQNMIIDAVVSLYNADRNAQIAAIIYDIDKGKQGEKTTGKSSQDENVKATGKEDNDE